MMDGVALFFAMGTQWQWVGIGMAGAMRVGLKYEALEAVARGANVAFSPAVFSDVRTLEAEALKAFGK